jgi:hypothetical protein
LAHLEHTQAVTAFAQAAARLADPFANRALLLAELGLTEAGWQALQRRWHEAMRNGANGCDRLLAEAFREAFVAERERLMALRSAQRLGDAREDRLVAPMTAPASVVDATGTSVPALKPALPFRGQSPAQEAYSSALAEAPADTGETAIVEALSESGVVGALPWDRRKP